ncbi:MAG: apolipoprotein N-acyltransferase [Pseudomonadota bacterium]
MSISTILREQIRWRAWLVSYAAGALLALGLAPFHLWPVIFISLPVCFLMLDAAGTTRRAALRAFFFGYGFFTAATWWISNAMLVDIAKFGWMIPFSILGLSAALALWVALFGALFHRLKTGRLSHDMLRFALLWVAVEYLRSIGMFGFPWGLLGYVALASLPVMQTAALIGTFGLSLLAALLGLLPLVFLRAMPKKQRVCWCVAAVLLLVASYGYGTLRLPPHTALSDTTLRIVQPNIPQTLKGTREGQAESINTLRALTRQAGTTAPQVTIWPETAYPFTVRGDQGPLLMPNSGLLLTGAVRAATTADGFAVWNSLLAMDPMGTIQASYDKHQLVPFGEFVPLRSVLPLDKITPGNVDFSRGEGVRTLTLGGMPSFSPLVCYEVIFPWMAADNAARPEWLVNVTNDGWYGNSPGPYQHFDMARMRAVEQGLPLVRAANSGISAVIDPHGRVTAALPLSTRGLLDAPLPRPLPPTPYAQWGETLIVAALVLSWFGSLLLFRRAKHK